MKSKIKNIVIWIIQILLAAAFIMVGLGKLAGRGEWVNLFSDWGYPQYFYLFIGAVEAICGILMLIPKTVGYSVVVLIIVMIGAALTHLLNNESLGQIIGSLVYLTLLLIVGFVRKPEIFSRIRPAKVTT